MRAAMNHVFSRAKLEVSTGVNGRRACGSISGLRLRFYFLSFVRWRIVMVRGGERLVLGTEHLDVKER